MIDPNGYIDDVRFLNAIVFVARSYGVEPDWDQCDVEGKYIVFKREGDIKALSQALARLFDGAVA